MPDASDALVRAGQEPAPGSRQRYRANGNERDGVYDPSGNGWGLTIDRPVPERCETFRTGRMPRPGGRFTDPRLVEDRPIGIADPLIEERVAPTRFYSATYRLFKLPGLEPDCEDYGQAVAYRGTLSRHPGAWSLDKHHRFATGKVAPVCGNTQRMLYETRLRPHFDFFGGGGQHLGIFEGCGTGLPFATPDDGEAPSGGCC